MCEPKEARGKRDRGHRTPSDTRERVGRGIQAERAARAGRAQGVAVVARALNVSTRVVRHWAEQADRTPARIGRPPHPPEALRKALKCVRRIMRKHGRSVGEPKVMKILGDERLPLRLVRYALKCWKAYDGRQAMARRGAKRQSLRISTSGAVLSIDAAQAGRLGSAALHLLQAVDGATGATCAARVGRGPTSETVVALLESVPAAGLPVPIAVFHDGGSENVNSEVRAWARREQVVLVRSRPHTPQHNPWVERKHRSVRELLELRASTPLESPGALVANLSRALDVLDVHRRPCAGPLDRSHPGRDDTVTQLGGGKGSPPRYSPAWREAVYRAAESARESARTSCARARDRPMAERKAVLNVLEQYGVLSVVRGAAPR